MIRLRHFIILGLLAIAGRLIAINERALQIGTLHQDDANSPCGGASRCSIAGRVLLASLVGMWIIMTWLWFVMRAMG